MPFSRTRNGRAADPRTPHAEQQPTHHYAWWLECDGLWMMLHREGCSARKMTGSPASATKRFGDDTGSPCSSFSQVNSAQDWVTLGQSSSKQFVA